MKMSWRTYGKDARSFKVPERLGFDVFKLEDLEKTDNKIKELIDRRYDTIIMTNELASFSGDIIKKYSKDRNISIIIAQDKE